MVKKKRLNKKISGKNSKKISVKSKKNIKKISGNNSKQKTQKNSRKMTAKNSKKNVGENGKKIANNSKEILSVNNKHLLKVSSSPMMSNEPPSQDMQEMQFPTTKRVDEEPIAPVHLKSRDEKNRKIKRVPTGVHNFDSLIEGGFEQSSTNLLVGDAGVGKTIFALQFLVEGMKHGDPGLFVSFEEDKKQFYQNMKRFGWDFEAYEKKKLFTFLEYSPMKVKTMLEEGGGSIESIILKNKISRIVIDSITSFALLFKDELERREAALALFGMIRDWNCTSLLTLEKGTSVGEETMSTSLEFETDSIIRLYYLRDKSQRRRYLEIIKMKGTAHSQKVFPFAIEKKGIVVQKKPVSGFVASDA